VILAGSVGVAYVVLVLVFVPRLNDREQRKAIIRYELGFLLFVEIVISGLGVPVYRWGDGLPAPLRPLTYSRSLSLAWPGWYISIVPGDLLT
jgi:hypothetical protein